MKRIIVTGALPYANGPIHLGHLVEYIQTDIFVRFKRLTGHDVVFCCADDTHGTPIEIKASEKGISPKELIDACYRDHLKDFSRFHIEFDSFHSTDSEENQILSNHFFNKLKEKGLIYTKDILSLYDEKAGRYLPDRYVKGTCPRCKAKGQYGDACDKCNWHLKAGELIDPVSTLTGERPVKKSSKHYFFALTKVVGEVEKWLESAKSLQPEIVNYVKSWFSEGIQDWDISRDGPYFGFKIPGEEDKYFYVWLDAPIGYISSFAKYLGEKDPEKIRDEWNSSDIVHFIGKDITYFHFLFWPAMLNESGFSMPGRLIVHGFLTVNGEKMSKSKGTFITASDFADEHDPEYLRFYYARVLSKKVSDINLDMDDFRKEVNNELVANIGNFCYRTMHFLSKNFDCRYGEIDCDDEIEASFAEKKAAIAESYENANTNVAIRHIMSLSTLGNRYFQSNAPWELIKSDEKRARKVLGLCINIVHNLSILISPILPNFSKELQAQLKTSCNSWDDIGFSLKSHEIGIPSPLIKKVDPNQVKKFPLDLRIAKVISVKDHPDADKLYVLEIDIGSEKRIIVAGLKKHYSKEDLVQKKIVIVANLKPAKLRGILSHGMLLAGDDGNDVGVLYAEKSAPGDKVTVSRMKNETKELTYDQFLKLSLKVEGGRASFEDKILMANTEEIKVDKVRDGNIG